MTFFKYDKSSSSTTKENKIPSSQHIFYSAQDIASTQAFKNIENTSTQNRLRDSDALVDFKRKGVSLNGEYFTDEPVGAILTFTGEKEIDGSQAEKIKNFGGQWLHAQALFAFQEAVVVEGKVLTPQLVAGHTNWIIEGNNITAEVTDEILSAIEVTDKICPTTYYIGEDGQIADFSMNAPEGPETMTKVSALAKEYREGIDFLTDPIALDQSRAYVLHDKQLLSYKNESSCITLELNEGQLNTLGSTFPNNIRHLSKEQLGEIHRIIRLKEKDKNVSKNQLESIIDMTPKPPINPLATINIKINLVEDKNQNHIDIKDEVKTQESPATSAQKKYKLQVAAVDLTLYSPKLTYKAPGKNKAEQPEDVIENKCNF